MKKVAIIPGFAEGPWHAQQLRQTLINQGFQIAEDDSTADIIIAHSAGCYFMPKEHRAQTVLLVGPPYWPGKSLGRSMLQKVYRDARARRREQQTAYWFKKSGWNAFYFFGDLRLAVAATLATRRRTWHEILDAPVVIVARNADDSWTTPDLHQLLAENPKTRLIELPGEHDDLWLNPEPYVNLIQSD